MYQIVVTLFLCNTVAECSASSTQINFHTYQSLEGEFDGSFDHLHVLNVF